MKTVWIYVDTSKQVGDGVRKPGPCRWVVRGERPGRRCVRIWNSGL